MGAGLLRISAFLTVGAGIRGQCITGNTVDPEKFFNFSGEIARIDPARKKIFLVVKFFKVGLSFDKSNTESRYKLRADLAPCNFCFEANATNEDV